MAGHYRGERGNISRSGLENFRDASPERDVTEWRSRILTGLENNGGQIGRRASDTGRAAKIPQARP